LKEQATEPTPSNYYVKTLTTRQYIDSHGAPSDCFNCVFDEFLNQRIGAGILELFVSLGDRAVAGGSW
jgi:hypothetical protein